MEGWWDRVDIEGPAAPCLTKDANVRELYRQELAQLGSELERMGRGVNRAIDRATTALREADIVLAEQTIDADERLDDNARTIDEMCLHLLALQSPVASDLRLIISALRLSQTMERQGDLARHIASIARSTHPTRLIADPAAELIEKMAASAARMGELEEQMVLTQDPGLLDEIQRLDDVLDDDKLAVHRLVADESIELTRRQVVDLTLGARFFERFGDHAVSVARRVTFIVEGVNLPYEERD